jgi:ABC-type antimicrobial peptide transport system permease subunit
MTLALGVVGLYGVIAYVVNLRAREIGIRIALGLSPSRATRMIVRQGEVVVVLGAATGALVFLAFARLLRSLTYGVSVVDGTSLGIAVAIVIAVASVATWLPARRAARIDPAEALRNE